MSGRIFSVLCLFGLIATGGWSTWQHQAGAGTIRFFDIGQGDAALVSGTHHRQMLIDAGPDGAILSQLGRSLPPFDRTIEVAVISHPHADHYRGFRTVLGRYRIKQLYLSATTESDSEYRSLVEEARRMGTVVRSPHAGERIEVGDTGVRFITAGDENATPQNLNNASVVMSVTMRGQLTLFTGDAEAEEERQLLRDGLPTATILKVPHHGSKTSSTEEFLEAVQPKLAVVSVGARNRYGHPNAATVERLRASGATVYRTDQSGTVTVHFRDGGYAVTTDR